MSARRRAAYWIGLSTLLAAATNTALPQQKYGERETLDPDREVWVPSAEPVAFGPSAGILAEARELLAKGEYGEARKRLSRWTKDNPDDEQYYDVMYLLGEAWFGKKDFYRAYEEYEAVVENTSGDIYFQALRREMDVARAFLSGQKRILWKIFRLPAYDDGVQILDRVWERVPGSGMGETALKVKADYFFDHDDMGLAQDEYVLLAREYPSGRYVQSSMLRAAEAAEATFPGVQFTDKPLLEAGERYRQLRSTFPVYAEREQVDARLEGIRQQRAEKDLEVARYYRRAGRPGAAEFYYRLVLRDWPGTLAAGEARLELRGLNVDVDEPVGEAPATQPAEAPPAGETQPASAPMERGS